MGYAAAAKSLQSCPTLCDPTDGSPPGSPVPGILQARTLEWVAISFSSAWKVKSESEVAQSCPVSDSSQPHGLQPTRLLCPWEFSGKSTGVGCHCLLLLWVIIVLKSTDFFNVWEFLDLWITFIFYELFLVSLKFTSKFLLLLNFQMKYKFEKIFIHKARSS